MRVVLVFLAVAASACGVLLSADDEETPPIVDPNLDGGATSSEGGAGGNDGGTVEPPIADASDAARIVSRFEGAKRCTSPQDPVCLGGSCVDGRCASAVWAAVNSPVVGLGFNVETELFVATPSRLIRIPASTSSNPETSRLIPDGGAPISALTSFAPGSVYFSQGTAAYITANPSVPTGFVVTADTRSMALAPGELIFVAGRTIRSTTGTVFRTDIDATAIEHSSGDVFWSNATGIQTAKRGSTSGSLLLRGPDPATGLSVRSEWLYFHLADAQGSIRRINIRTKQEQLIVHSSVPTALVAATDKHDLLAFVSGNFIMRQALDAPPL